MHAVPARNAPAQSNQDRCRRREQFALRVIEVRVAAIGAGNIDKKPSLAGLPESVCGHLRNSISFITVGDSGVRVKPYGLHKRYQTRSALPSHLSASSDGSKSPRTMRIEAGSLQWPFRATATPSRLAGT